MTKFYIVPLLFISSLGLANNAFDITSISAGQFIPGQHIYVYHGNDDIVEIRGKLSNSFEPGSSQLIRFPRDENLKTFWVRVNLLNPTPKETEFILDGLLFPYDETLVYINGIFKSEISKQVEFKKYIRIALGPGEQKTLHLKISPHVTRYLILRKWDDSDSFQKDRSDSRSFFPFALAVVLMSILCNIMMIASFKDRASSFYVAYLISLGSFLYGIWQYSTLPVDPKVFIPSASNFMSIFVVLFSIYFLNIQRYPKLYMTCKILVACCLIPFVVTPLNVQIGFLTVQFISIFGAPFCILCGIVVYMRNKESYALIYCFAFGSMIAGVLLTIAFNMGIVTDIRFRSGIIYGALVENIIMLVAMGQKIYSSERNRKHNFDQLAKVFYPHQLQQMSLGLPLEATMPVGEEEACVLSFDVIDSSSYKISEKWEEFMIHVRSIMMDKYNPKTLSSTGYMIKEMGDGFLCSVGFPFGTTGSNLCSDAASLALHLTKLFSAIMNQDKSEENICCSIGIAKGKVKAYFSKSGAIRHDMWGAPLVHATRYESLRKKLG